MPETPDYEINIGDDGTIEAVTPDGEYQVEFFTTPPFVVTGFDAGLIQVDGDRAYVVSFSVMGQDEKVVVAMNQETVEKLVGGLIDTVES
jgi:hypothetical protein